MVPLLVGEDDDDDFFLHSLLQYSISFTDSATAAAIGMGSIKGGRLFLLFFILTNFYRHDTTLPTLKIEESRRVVNC